MPKTTDEQLLYYWLVEYCKEHFVDIDDKYHLAGFAKHCKEWQKVFDFCFASEKREKIQPSPE